VEDRQLPLTSATGVNVSHAIARALATANLNAAEATYRVESARAWLDSQDNVARAEVTIRIRKAQALHQWEPHQLDGWVNADGEHPGMALVRLADPIFVDTRPVTWGRLTGGRRPPPNGASPDHPCVDAGHGVASKWASARGCRLPSATEFQALWGAAIFPWGEQARPTAGRVGPVRYGRMHEVGLYPPCRGLHDLGTWLWHWLADGTAAGGMQEGVPAFGIAPEPWMAAIGFRTVADP
jgi:hypothetical protein